VGGNVKPSLQATNVQEYQQITTTFRGLRKEMNTMTPKEQQALQTITQVS